MTAPAIPAFDQPVARNGYAWWYLDAISDDGRHGLTIIAFVGSVFSPYYARARARGRGDPMAHCAINVALYGPSGRWSMTERGSSAVVRQPDSLQIGPSGLQWDGQRLNLDLMEWAVPLLRRISGQIRVEPVICNDRELELDPNGRHRWTPVWPQARVEVALEHPGLGWSGHGYLDHNAGSEPLEHCFDSWFWLRASTSHGPAILYDTRYRDGQRRALALRFDRRGELLELPPPDPVELPRSRWGIARPARSEDGQAHIEAAWEDTPFYTRSLVSTALLGERVTAVHESLSLPRFSAFWVQLMLPFRMPRRP